MQSGFFRLCFHSSYQFGNLAPIQAHYLTAASTRKSIYINPTLQFYYTTYLSGDLIIQASFNQRREFTATSSFLRRQESSVFASRCPHNKSQVTGFPPKACGNGEPKPLFAEASAEDQG